MVIANQIRFVDASEALDDDGASGHAPLPRSVRFPFESFGCISPSAGVLLSLRMLWINRENNCERIRFFGNMFVSVIFNDVEIIWR